MRRTALSWRRSKKILRKQVRRPTTGFAIALLCIGGIALNHSFSDQLSVHEAAYKPLLDTIAKGESGGNYNAYFGNARNEQVRFTDMSLKEVLIWQDAHVKAGNISNAVGKYQIIRPTLLELIKTLELNEEEVFNQVLQDRLAIALLERRGSVAFVSNKLSNEEFAANLAKEWAALPKTIGPNPEESYYASDGINKAHVATDEVFQALHLLKSAVNSHS